MSKYLAFVSYAWGRPGHPFAKNVEKMVDYMRNVLAGKGDMLFFDTTKMEAGDRIQKTIVQAIENSPSIIIFFNNFYARSLTSPIGIHSNEPNYWCPREFIHFLKTNEECSAFDKRIIVLSFNPIDQQYNNPEELVITMPNSSVIMGLLHKTVEDFDSLVLKELDKVCNIIGRDADIAAWIDCGCGENREIFHDVTQQEWEISIKRFLPASLVDIGDQPVTPLGNNFN